MLNEKRRFSNPDLPEVEEESVESGSIRKPRIRIKNEDLEEEKASVSESEESKHS